LVLETSQQEKKTFLKRLKREALKRLVERLLLSLTSFIVFYFIGHLIIQGIINQGIVLSLPDKHLTIDPFPLSAYPLFIIVPLTFGVISSLITWKVLSRRLVSLKLKNLAV